MAKPLSYYLDPAEREKRLCLNGFNNLLINWQEGPIGEVGPNGVLPEDVLQVVLERLRVLNEKPFNTREGSLAITDIESAMNWLLRRRINRDAAGTLGTGQP